MTKKFTRQIYIAQLHFRIGVMKDFLAIGDFLASRDIDVHYILSDGYMPHIRQDLLPKTIFINTFSGRYGLALDFVRFVAFGWLFWKRFFQNEKPDYFLLYLVHPVSSLIFMIGKMLAPACRFGVCIHEPITYKPVVTRKTMLGAYLREWFQSCNIHLSCDVVLFSDFGRTLFDKKYRFKGTKHVVNFVYASINPEPKETRTVVNISNTLYPDGRSKLFADIILTAAKKCPQVKFRLVTNRIDTEIELLLEKEPPNFELVNPEVLSDGCVLDSIQRGLVQLIGHRNITQSGVLPIAFQCGTPVLARDMPGFSQFIEHKKSGYLVRRDAEIEEWLEGIHYIIDNFNEMSRNCLIAFKKYFGPQNLNRYYGWLVDYLVAGARDRSE